MRCPFHRWSWDLAGKLREVPSRRGFGTLPAADYGLFPVAVESWGPFVFVDPSGTAGSLWNFLEGVPEDISWIALDEFRCDYLVTVPLPGNWKIISDGFSETYHVQGLHREMLPSVDDVNGPQRLWRHHGKLEQRYGLPSPRFREPPDTETTWRSFVEIMGARVGVTDPAAPTPPVPAGATLREVLAGMVRTVGEAAGVSYERFSDDQMMTMQQYNLFPNVSLVIFPDLLTVLRARPGPTPDAGFLDIINYHRAAAGRAVPAAHRCRAPRGPGARPGPHPRSGCRERGPGPARPRTTGLHPDDPVPGGVPHSQHAPEPRAVARHRPVGDPRRRRHFGPRSHRGSPGA